jgi:hypothetical protein
MDPNNVFRAEKRVFILEIKVSWTRVLMTARDRDLACSVDDFTLELGAFVLDGLLEITLNCGVVVFHKLVLDELHNEGGLSCNRSLGA